MSAGTTSEATLPDALDARVSMRILQEGYGPGAWHGADFKAALDDVSAATAMWRPGTERHNIAEIALHHAYQVHGVRERLAGTSPGPFLLEGEDWFRVSDETSLPWPRIRATVAAEHQALTDLIGDIADGRVRSPLTQVERFDLVLGITCHAVYHAGQVQLLKRLHAG